MSQRRQPVLGILGGGQLARMLALAAAPLGVKTLVVDEKGLYAILAGEAPAEAG